jgi:hypothetical protein
MPNSNKQQSGNTFTTFEYIGWAGNWVNATPSLS